jgi:hypothetical protein
VEKENGFLVEETRMLTYINPCMVSPLYTGAGGICEASLCGIDVGVTNLTGTAHASTLIKESVRHRGSVGTLDRSLGGVDIGKGGKLKVDGVVVFIYLHDIKPVAIIRDLDWCSSNGNVHPDNTLNGQKAS